MPSSVQDLLDAGFRFALSISRESDFAKDLVQEAYLRMIEKYNFKILDISHKSLYFKIIHRLFIDNYRQNKKKSVLSEIQYISISPIGEKTGDNIEIEYLFDNLKPMEREVLYLYY